MAPGSRCRSTAIANYEFMQNATFLCLEIVDRRAGGISGLAGRRPPCAPHTTDRDEPSGGIITVATTGSAPPLVPRRSEHERRNDRQPAIWHRHRPSHAVSRARRRPCARRALSTARSAARIPRYAHDAISGQPAPPSGRVGRRTGHAPHPHADGPIHVWRHLRRTGSAPAVEPGGRCRHYRVPTGPRWAACDRTGSHLAR